MVCLLDIAKAYPNLPQPSIPEGLFSWVLDKIQALVVTIH